jgi:putative endonuclease
MANARYLFVYLLTNSTRSVLYTGVTGDLRRRVAQHRMGDGGRFTRRYRAHRLVWYELHESPVSAILREKQIKAGSRRQKTSLIEAVNPDWRDLGDDL